VCGPPGAGKTTLVASYVSEREIPGIWYQVDAGDGDPATFFYYLGMAADQAAKGKHKPLPLLTPEFQQDLDGFSRRYFRELFARLQSAPCWSWTTPRRRLPIPRFKPFSSRSSKRYPRRSTSCASAAAIRPPRSPVMPTGRLATLAWADLRLTLRKPGRSRGQATHRGAHAAAPVRAIRRLGGWRHLMLERMARTGDVPEAIEGDARSAVQLLRRNAVRQAAGRTQQVLLRTAFLRRSLLLWRKASPATLTPAAARASASPPPVPHRRRLGLVRSPVGRRATATDEATYEYHALFRDFLLAKAQEEYSRAGLRRLLEETARLLEAIERDEEALALYRDAEDWDAATRLLLKQSPRLLRQGRGQTLREWITGMPAAQVGVRPWISYWLVYR
jgi:hypothetical protein